MLLQISTTWQPATDLGYLLAKNPARAQTFDLSFGKAHCFYPEANEELCTAALLLDVDPVGLVRGRGGADGQLDQYVNDRPYAASTFLSVALAQVFRTAMGGQSKERPELAAASIPLVATVENVPCRGGEAVLRSLFEPLGYEIGLERLPLDERFPSWGESRYFRLKLTKETRLSELLTHLYVLLPVLDGDKHYYVGEDEVNKLLRHGAGWLESHPAREYIVSRYLKRRSPLVKDALARLTPEAIEDEDENGGGTAEEAVEQALVPAAEARTPSLHVQRLNRVLKVLRASGAQRILDLGCGEGRLIRELLADRQFTEIVGVDASHRALEIAEERLRLERLPEARRSRLKLLHGALTYRDDRLKGYDAAAVVEVIEHLDPGRLRTFERVLWEFARPGLIVLTTPNAEYNVKWPALAGRMRHPDHRFEWTRAEFEGWAAGVAERYGYIVEFEPLGPVEEGLGGASQMGVFRRS